MNHADDIDAMQIGPDPDKLLVYHRRQLSAMLDGELSPDEAKFMLRRLQHDGELAACWERWQVCGDMLRGRQDALLPADFATRVARAIAGDAGDVATEAAPARAPRLLRWGGGAALAASVALVAVFATRQLSEQPQPLPAGTSEPIVASAQPAPAAVFASVSTADDASNDAPATPVPVEAAAPAVLATALAVAERPRRDAERRARTRPAQPSQAPAQTQAGTEAIVLASGTAMPPSVEPEPSRDHFPSPPALQARPWPRAILPAANDHVFSVGYGALPAASAPDGTYDPFRPRIVLRPLAASAIGTDVADRAAVASDERDDGSP